MCFILLGHKSSQHSGLGNTYSLSLSFCGSGVQAPLSSAQPATRLKCGCWRGALSSGDLARKRSAFKLSFQAKHVPLEFMAAYFLKVSKRKVGSLMLEVLMERSCSSSFKGLAWLGQTNTLIFPLSNSVQTIRDLNCSFTFALYCNMISRRISHHLCHPLG